ncbi:Myb-like DNA-binding domain-containing protein [Spironucleus salmonicida]|uniref:Myb-like DNA-binding domain-containing protein n=1 Tax=Spironucleus salmonicida TaxID=348837 RepID=V6LN51_9EUKA|nr:Myb-like DNA-binding domain-containing protein [Spironucleus salmonicida]|eukprot:EST46122.1 Myb-like DNA-binding domain-containing protein [Spironucleus salmonicida]
MGKQWTQAEIAQLLASCQLNQRNNSHIVDWNLVMADMPQRSKAQCQTYVNNYLRRKQQELKSLERHNYHWQECDSERLFDIVSQFGADWEIIRRHSFPTLSAQRLRVKYLDYCKMQKLQREQAKTDTEGGTLLRDLMDLLAQRKQ